MSLYRSLNLSRSVRYRTEVRLFPRSFCNFFKFPPVREGTCYGPEFWTGVGGLHHSQHTCLVVVRLGWVRRRIAICWRFVPSPLAEWKPNCFLLNIDVVILRFATSFVFSPVFVVVCDVCLIYVEEKKCGKLFSGVVKRRDGSFTFDRVSIGNTVQWRSASN